MRTRSIASEAILVLALSSATALATADAVPSHPATKAGSFRVTATANTTEPLQGDPIKIKGTVKQAAPGAKVTLQVHYVDGRKWKTLDSTTLSNHSKYKFEDKALRVSQRVYRVVKPSSANHAAAHSPKIKVTVYGWRDLTTLSPANVFGFHSPVVVTMNGVAYRHSLRSFSSYSYPPWPPPYPPSTIDYDLNRACKAFRGVVGLDDSSPGDGTAQVSLLADGATRYSGGFGLIQSQSAPVEFDVAGVFSLTVSALNFTGGTRGSGDSAGALQLLRHPGGSLTGGVCAGGA